MADTPTPKAHHAPPKQKDSTKMGIWLIGTGLAGLAIAVIISMIPALYASALDNGALPAVSFFFVSLGMAFHFPDLLQDESKSLSTMRVVVFITVMIFAIVCIKLAWAVKTFDEFRIDRTWVYILGLAFGSKVFQSFSEESGKGKQPDVPEEE